MTAVRPADLITAAHRHVARMIATAFALTPFEGLRAYQALRFVLARDLTASERQGLAWAALGACTAEQAQGIAASLVEADEPIDPPCPPFDPQEVAEDAELWAVIATPAERLAYARAILRHLSPEERVAVLSPAPGTGG